MTIIHDFGEKLPYSLLSLVMHRILAQHAENV